MCRHNMLELHVDVSLASAEIFAASVACSELLHVGIVNKTMMCKPLLIDATKDSSIKQALVHRWRMHANSVHSCTR